MFNPSFLSLSSNPLRWFVVIVLVFIAQVTIGSSDAATALFINNSVVFSLLGEVNGLAHTLAAALRYILILFVSLCTNHKLPTITIGRLDQSLQGRFSHSHSQKELAMLDFLSTIISYL